MASSTLLIAKIESAVPRHNASFQCCPEPNTNTNDDNEQPNTTFRVDSTSGIPCRCFGTSNEASGTQGSSTSSSSSRPLTHVLQEYWNQAMNVMETLLDNPSLHGTTNPDFATKSMVWFNKLWTLHCDCSRHYHTAVHLEEMIFYLSLVWEEEKDDEANPIETASLGTVQENHEEDNGTKLGFQNCIVLLAIFFHDAIYNVHSSTNEQDSALLFRQFALDVGLVKDANHSKVDVNKTDTSAPTTTLDLQRNKLVCGVQDSILATQHHQLPDHSTDGDDMGSSMALLLDLDLAVLGKDWPAYRAYAALIRCEYAHVPRETYCQVRAGILERMTQQPMLFHTLVFRKALQEQAMANLTQEIALLKQGNIPGQSTETMASG